MSEPMEMSEASKLLRSKYPKGTIEIDTGRTENENQSEAYESATIRLFGYGIKRTGDSIAIIVRGLLEKEN